MTSRVLRVLAFAGLIVVVVALGQYFRVQLSPAQEWDFDAACDAGTPYYAAVCYRGTGRARDLSLTYDLAAPAVVLFSDTPNDAPQYVLATYAEVGAVWGLAYSRGVQALYASAFQKRQFLFGPGGPGAIYRIDLTTGAITPFATVPNIRADTHETALDASDALAGQLVGRTSLGDLDLSSDEETLFVVNVDDRRIYRYSLPDGALLGSFANGASGEPWADQARPFGLEVYGGLVYHGVVNSAETSVRTADLKAVVYESAPDGSAMRKVLEVPLDYGRGFGRPNGMQPVPIDWRPWLEQNVGRMAGTPPVSVYPMPVLADIAFDSHRNMVLGFRDRRSDSTRYYLAKVEYPYVLRPDWVGYGFGDILLGAKDGAQWSVDTSREFYRDGVQQGSDETATGGLAAGFDIDEFAAGSMPASGNSPGSAIDEGINWYDGATGAKTAHERLCQVMTHFDRSGPRPLAMQRRKTDIAGAVGRALRRAANRASEPAYADNGELPGTISVRGPATIGDVEVLCRAVIPSPTASATATATPTATATSTAPAATATGTRVPEPIYLPINIKEAGCVPGGHHTDVAIIVDASTSMEEFTRTGRPKIAAAREAAALFIGELDLAGGDRAAIVQFNGGGEVLQDLTDDAGALRAALGRISMAQQTRIQIGLALATEELLSPRHRPQNSRAAILLTDGRNNPEPVAVAMAEADLAKQAGIRVFTIGLGSELDLEALAAMASSPDGFYLAPDGEDLVEIYRRIANVIPCPPKVYWPGRR